MADYVRIKLIFAVLFWHILKIKCQLADNTPPTMWLERNWEIPDTEVPGTVITKVHGSDSEDDHLVYGLEGIDTDVPLPFTINNDTGVVYLNDSLVGRAGENFILYVTVTDGQLPAKTEVNVNIFNSTDPRGRNGRKPPGHLFKPSFLQIPVFNPQQTYSNNGNPIRLPGQPVFQQKTYPDIPVQVPVTSERTVLLPVTKISVTTSTSTKEDLPLVDSNSVLPQVPVDEPVKSLPDLTVTLVPVVSVCAVFVVVGVIALVFRRKLCLGNVKGTKDDMRKDPTGGIVIQEDLAMQQWRGPQAFSNRYEPWERDPSNNPGNVNNTSTGVDGGPPPPPPPADRWEFPRHRLKFFNILGEGAFGQVWKCEAMDIDGREGLSVVAVKTLKENASEKERSDLTSELQVMKMLEPHPNVVRLLGCCAEKQPFFLIMEFIAGGKLQSYLRSSRAERCYDNMHGQSGTLTSRDLTSFVHQVARGMEFLSSNGIIHRDLAARNILIAEDHTCKVADFGFARDVIASHIYERKSEGRLPIRWMSPEALYDNLFSVKSDVWSFGVLIWEVVTLGSTPYPGLSAAEVMRKVRDGYRLDKPEHCRRELYNIMYYCWDKDPKQRPPFSECIELLEKLLMSETDYIELERFPDHSYYNMLSLSGEKL